LDIPLIDIAPFFSEDAAARHAVALAWGAAMRSSGFAIISGHGIAEISAEGVYNCARDFFARPLDRKMALCFSDMMRGQGYLPLGNERVGKARVANARPDLCESLTFCATRGARENLWPADMPGFRETIETYIAAGNRLARSLMRLSALALGLPENYFAPFFEKMNSDLRCVLYPEQSEAPQAGQLRYGPHTDFSGFTILRQDCAPGGLQVKTGEGWADVPSIPGSLVINAGDLIQRWTNDRWISNIHRVTNPPRDKTHGARRLSIVLFTGPNSDAVIESLPTCGVPNYAPIVAGAHVQERIAGTYGNLAPGRAAP
jgi:isopenicillin N synthase-like dioxygenase